MKYNKEIAVKLYEKYKSDLGKYKHIAEYFKGNTDAKKNYPQTDRSNNFETYNFIKKFTIEEVSFMVGNPITYISAEGNVENIKNIENPCFKRSSIVICSEKFKCLFLRDSVLIFE